jgi:hypothetical protein
MKNRTIKHAEKLKRFFPFHVERDITEEDWQGMHKELKKHREEKQWILFSNHASAMKSLDPNINITSKEWRNIHAKLESFRDSGSWDWFAERASEIKYLDPPYVLNLKPRDWQGMHSILEQHRRKGEWGLFAKHAAAMKDLIRMENDAYA